MDATNEVVKCTAPTEKRINARGMPFLSECVLLLMDVIVSVLYFLLPSSAPTLSTFFIGGLFGLLLVPTALAALALKAVDVAFPQLPGGAFYCIGLPVLALYLLTVMLLDSSHLRPQRVGAFRRPDSFFSRRSFAFWSTHFDYFPMTLVASPKVSLPPSKQYVFGVHPHGIHCWPLNALAFPGSCFDKAFPGLCGAKLTGLAATVIFKIPLVRELFLTMGYVDAGRPTATRVLQGGRSLFVCTGGEHESLLTSIGVDVVVLSSRKGFVRLAVLHGATLVPVFGAGVSDLYSTYDLGTLGLRLWVQKTFGVALPVFHGRALSPLPYRRPVRVLVGEGIEVPKFDGDAEADKDRLNKIVDEYHAKYVEALKKLHADNVKDRTLKII